MGYKIKKYQISPIHAKVLDGLDNGSHTDAPSVAAVGNALYKPNLLINGDFQVWQRGETIEFNSTNTQYNMNKYHADMWFSYFSRTDSDVLKFEKVNNGIRCTLSRHTNISQYITEELDNTKDYIFVVSINDTKHILRFKGQETKSNEFMQHSSKETTGSYNRLIIFVKNNDVVNWACLFEGDIAYPYVKEDYSIALMRCHRFAREIEINSSGYLAGSAQIKGTINFYIEMDLSPTFTVVDIGTKHNVSSVGVLVNSKRLIYTIVSTGAGQVVLDGYKLFITCEPL